MKRNLFKDSEIQILKIISENPGIMQTEITDKADVTHGAVSRSRRKLEDRGLVEHDNDLWGWVISGEAEKYENVEEFIIKAEAKRLEEYINEEI